jgi:transposase InsO family protein
MGKSLKSGKFELIKQMADRPDCLLTIKDMCASAGVSRNGYYKWLNSAENRENREKRDEEDYALILEAFNYRGYKKGARSIHMRLLRRNPPVLMNVKKIWRLMRKNMLVCPYRKTRCTSKRGSATDGPKANWLKRRFDEFGPRSVLLTDITYIPHGNGKFSCLSVVLDACTKQILGWACSESLEVAFVHETLENVIRDFGNELNPGARTLFHSDQGSHYKSISLQSALSGFGFLQSMSRRGNCWDNAPQESFFGHMKDELKKRAMKTHAQIVDEIGQWIDYYNNDRPSWHLFKLTPNEYCAWVKGGKWPYITLEPKRPIFKSLSSVENEAAMDELLQSQLSLLDRFPS